MARARNIKPGFFTNDVLAECSALARILFQGLWCHADREGRLEDRPRKLKAEILPYDDCDAEELLCQLESRGFIIRYSHGDERFIQVVNFCKHQNPHVKESESTIPAPCLSGAKPEQAGLIPDSLNLIPDPLNLSPDCSTNTDYPTLPRVGDEPPNGASKPGAVCVVLKSEGIASVNPGHAGLLATLRGGATIIDFVAAAGLAKKAQKPTFAYVLGIVKNQLQDAKSPMQPGQKISSDRNHGPESFRERDARRARDRWEAETGRVHPGNAARDGPAPPAGADGVGGGGSGEIIEAQTREIVG